MINFLRKIFRPHPASLDAVIERQFKANKGVFKDLRDYDAGKKDISTTNIEKLIGDLHQ